MDPISADSHVMEAEDVFIGLPERFGDAAPRVVNAGTDDDAIVIPALGARGVRKRMGWAGLRMRNGVTVERRTGHKPEVDDLTDAEARKLLAKGEALDEIFEDVPDNDRRKITRDNVTALYGL